METQTQSQKIWFCDTTFVWLNSESRFDSQTIMEMVPASFFNVNNIINIINVINLLVITEALLGAQRGN